MLRLAEHSITIPAENWIDIQDIINFNGPWNRTVMGDLAATLVHESYEGMKKRFPEKGHQQWEMQPLPEVNLYYAAIDGYLSSELYKRLKKIINGLSDAPPREVLCPNCEDAVRLASLPFN